MHNHSNGNELCIFMQRTRYHLNGSAPRLAEGISNSEMACYFILTKGGFVPLSQLMHTEICGNRLTSDSLRNHFKLSTFSPPCWINSRNAMQANVTMSRWEWLEPDSVTSGFRENMGVCWECRDGVHSWFSMKVILPWGKKSFCRQ